MLYIGLGVLAALAILVMYIFNKLIRLRAMVRAGWSDIDVQLKRRYDLLPNLVETVKGYAEHEKELFQHIADARTQYFAAGSRGQKVEAANRIEGFLSRLLVLREQYPQLKANESFLKLQDQLEGTENRIAVERKRYNDAVRTIKTYSREFFGGYFCRRAAVDAAEFEYFEAPEAAASAPSVRF